MTEKQSKGYYPTLVEYIQQLDVTTISKERQAVLEPLIIAIKERVVTRQDIRLNFVCTHNSRRSHLAQIWGQVMAAYCSIEQVYTYSAGTEATALYPQVIKTLEGVGFHVKTLAITENPIYSIKMGANEVPIIGFSKSLESDFNPNHDFIAVLVCSSVEKECPFVAGASKRISVTFEDPKAYDGTPDMAVQYSVRSEQIATELLYVFSQIKKDVY